MLIIHDASTPAFPTLGEIVAARRKERRTSAMPHKEIILEYDKLFGMRADYRLWRTAIFTRPETPISRELADPWRHLGDGLISPDPIIKWGCASIIAGVLTGYRSAVYDEERLRPLVDEWERTLRTLPPLDGAHAGCAAIRAMLRDAMQHFRWDHHDDSMTLEEAEEYLTDLKRNLEQFDRSWRPGRTLSSRYVDRAKDTVENRLVLPFRHVDTLIRLVKVMYRARGVVLSALQRRENPALDARTERLLHYTAVMALSAWRTSRSVRAGELRWRTTHKPFVTNVDLNVFTRNDMTALQRASEAARDAGWYDAAAGLAHLLLRVVPDSLFPTFRRVGDGVGFTIRQAGLEVDPRFVDPRYRSKAAATVRISAAAIVSTESFVEGGPSGAPAADDADSEESAVMRVRPLDLRLRRDIESDPDWKPILEFAPTWLAPLRKLAFVADEDAGAHAPVDTLLPAFRLALRYAHLREAAFIARRLPPEAQWVGQYARAINRTLQIMPFGMDVEKYETWMRILRSAWSNIHYLDASVYEYWDVHEVLLGRFSSLVRSAGPDGGRLFAAKYYALLQDHEIGAIFDSSYIARKSGRSWVSLANFQQTVKTIPSPLGQPASLSLVLLSDDEVSILGISSQREIRRRERIPGLLHAIERLRANHQIWTKAMIWEKPFRILASCIGSVVDHLDPYTRWILLAPDAAFAGTPWQMLIRDCISPTKVISIVPSLSWVVLGQRRSHFNASDFQLALSSETQLDSLRLRIRETEHLLRARLGSAAVILGHGTRSGDMPSVSAGPNGQQITLARWIDALGGLRFVLVHSCHTGFGQRTFLGDLGGLPGLAMSLGCRLLCAPVSAVPIEAAVTLHEALIAEEGGGDFATCYLAAIEQDPTVALYTLYGLPGDGFSAFTSAFSAPSVTARDALPIL